MTTITMAKKETNILVPDEVIMNDIYIFRGQKVNFSPRFSNSNYRQHFKFAAVL
ncbi:MAG: hypothetical protein V4511_10925 [Bacteroidota bacterium]